MNFHETIRDTIKNHKAQVELIEWSIMAAIGTLIWAEYGHKFLHRMMIVKGEEDKHLPVQRIDIPTIHSVELLLDHDGDLMQILSDSLIDVMKKHPLMQKLKDAPELVLFRDENLEVLKCIFDAYIIPSITRGIPMAIHRKLDPYNPADGKQKLFHENRELDLFDYKPLDDDMINYIIEESVLQLVMHLPSSIKEVESPEDYMKIHVTDECIIGINNPNDIAPMYLNKTILTNFKDVTKLMMFVSGSSIHLFGEENSDVVGKHHDDIIFANLTSQPYNHVTRSYILDEIPDGEKAYHAEGDIA